MRVLAWCAAVVVGAMVMFEFLAPTGAERREVAAIFGLLALVTTVAGCRLPERARRSTSLSSTIAAVGLTTVAVVAGAVGVSAWRMFLSPHDLAVLVVVLAFAAGLGVVFSLSVSRPVTSDLEVIRHTARRVASGDLSARTALMRRDELGATAAAFDDMIGRLSAAEDRRLADERVRRELLTAIGHDLRTPLAALQAAVEALEDGVASHPARYLRSMRSDVTALGALVDDLFLLARIETGDLRVELQPVDLTELADETIEVLEPIAACRGIALVLLADGPATVFGDPRALGRVMRNLVDNAVRHAPPASEVVIRVSGGDTARVEVTDDGPGFAAELARTAFDSFVRGDPARARSTGGSGLGLAIARGLVDAHGGSIWAEPGPGGRVGFVLTSSPLPGLEAAQTRSPLLSGELEPTVGTVTRR